MTKFADIQRKLEDWQPSKVQAFWACVTVLVATLVVGFGPAGWVSAAAAQKLASESADNARRELAVAVCVDEFMEQRDASARLAKLKSVEFFRRSDLIATGGYATMPDRKEADDAVAARCAATLDEVQAPVAAKSTPVNAKR
jgi:hypothetical protein